MKIVTLVVAALAAFSTQARADWTDDVAQISGLMRAGHYAEAELAANASLKRGPGFMILAGTGTLNIHFLRGYSRLALGNSAGAMEDADVIIKENTVFAPPDMAYPLRGLAKAISGDAVGTQADFQAALDVDKSTFVAMRNSAIYGARGIANLLLNQFPAADADLSKAIATEVDSSMFAKDVAKKRDSWTLTRAAIAKFQRGDLDGARDDAKSARDIYGSARLEGEAVMAQLVVNKLEASQAARKEVQEDEWLLQAQAHLSRGDRVAAFHSYVKAFGESSTPSARDKAFEGIALIYPTLPTKPGLPEEARRYLVQSRVYVEDKNIGQAIGLYDKAIALAPWWPSAYFDRGLLLGQMGKHEGAIASMKRFLQLAPASENAREGQDKIYEWELKLAQQQQARGRRTASGGVAATLKQPSQSSSDCFIATAAYGSGMDPHVMALRQFRDDRLLPHAPGRWLVARYYEWSPPVADYIRDRTGLRAVVRGALAPVVWLVRYPWQILLGLGLIALTLVVVRIRASDRA